MKNRPSGNPCERSGGVLAHELRAEKQEEILRYLRAGMTLVSAAKRAGVAKSTVLNCARRHGLVDYALGKAGRPAGSYGKPKRVQVTVVSEVPNYRAQASHQRWGSALGSRWS